MGRRESGECSVSVQVGEVGDGDGDGDGDGEGGGVACSPRLWARCLRDAGVEDWPSFALRYAEYFPVGSGEFRTWSQTALLVKDKNDCS